MRRLLQRDDVVELRDIDDVRRGEEEACIWHEVRLEEAAVSQGWRRQW